MQLPQSPLSRRIISRDEWLIRGARFYGQDLRRWRFRCVACGHEQSHDVAIARNPELKTTEWLVTECEGNHTPGVGCKWVLGGTFALHRLEVIDVPARVQPCFEFADDPVGSWKPFMPATHIAQPFKVEP
jgi:hypothetical protein